MAALNVFQPFMDKENPEAGSRMSRLKAGDAGPRSFGGKTFLPSNIQGGQQTPMRRALGDVNRTGTHRSDGHALQLKLQPSLKNKQSVSFNPPTPASKPNKVKAEKPLKSTQRPQTRPSETFKLLPPLGKQKSTQQDDIENMPIQTEMQDDFDDIWPAAERPITYISALKSWRSWPFTYGNHSEMADDRFVSDDEVDHHIPFMELSLEDVEYIPYSDQCRMACEHLHLQDEILFPML